MEPTRTAPGAPARIAILDDDPVVVETLQITLTDEGYEVSVAREPVVGYALVSTRRPDLVILDFISPGRRPGLALLARLKRDAALRDIPVIVCTAATLDADQQGKLLRGHRVHFLPKPFELNTLLGMVEGVLHDIRR
jgi:DNA-binding response OmpR family regulator